MTAKPSDAQRKYWEAKLTKHGLSMERGTPDWLCFGHEVTDLDTDGFKTYRGDRKHEEWEPSSR